MGATELKIDARRQKILELLSRTGRVFVAELSREFGTTAATIRTDLDALERAGELERVQGGAIAKPKMARRESATERLPEKQAIGAAAAALIRDGDTLFMNSGTTTTEVAYAIRQHRKLNIVTNSVAIASELSEVPTFRVILLGGSLSTQYGFTYGGDAQEQLMKYQADHAIVSIDGVSREEGISTYHADEAILVRLMTERAKSTVVVADHTKIGRAGFTRICPLENVDILVTDSACPREATAPLERDGLTILRAEGK